MSHQRRAGHNGRKGGSIITETLSEPLGQYAKPKKHKKQPKGRQKH